MSLEDHDTDTVIDVFRAWKEQDHFLLAWLQSTIFSDILVTNPHGSYGTGFNHTFNCLLELVFDNLTMSFDLFLS